MTGANPGALFEKISAAAKAAGGLLDWRDYINICLYDSGLGYYARKKMRVGKEGADFYTSVSLDSKLFARLLAASAETLSGRNIEDFQIVEIGSEPERNIFENSKVFRLGDEVKLSGECAVFSNELLDAQPFCRFKVDGGNFLKGFLRLCSGNKFEEVFLPAEGGELALVKKYFDAEELEEGLRLDVSFDAIRMLESICAQDWRGVLVFADYFRNARELSAMYDGGARCYRRHESFFNLLEASDGESDITFSPCSEMFMDVLKIAGFESVSCAPQGKFFVENAAREIERIIASGASLSSEKRNLSALINPAAMGELFRVLSAVR